MGLDIFGASNYTDPQWTPNPDTRGTSGLILTCIVTLTLSVYSTLHLNVFDRQCKWWMRCLVKAKWVVIALLAPEFVVFNAWSQRRHALRIAKVLRRRSGQQEPDSFLTTLRRGFGVGPRHPDQEQGMKRNNINAGELLEEQVYEDGTFGKVRSSASMDTQQTFDISHGFLIAMGGLVIDMSRDSERVWPTWCNSLTITPACVEQCFGLDVFEDIGLGFLTKESIAGRSKTNYFTKFITTIQALWFCVQFFVRLGESLPISLLELNTFAHSICALATYSLWWRKPFEIDDPFVLHSGQSEALRDLCAAQWTIGASGKHYKKQCLYRSESEEVTLHSKWEPVFTHGGSQFLMNFFRGRSGITLLPGMGEDWYIFGKSEEERWFYYPRYQGKKRLKMRVSDNLPSAVVLKAGQPIPGTREHVDPQFNSVEVDSITLNRWKRALRTRSFLRNYSVWLRDRQPNFVWPRGLDSDDGHVIADELVRALFMFLVTSLCYGSLHMLAWDSAALNTAGFEEKLWKISCLNLIVLGPLAFIVWAGLKCWRGPDAHLNLSLAWSIILGVITAMGFLSYVMSRLYLVIEVFAVIPYMDPGVYRMPEYSTYWPHVG